MEFLDKHPRVTKIGMWVAGAILIGLLGYFVLYPATVAAITWVGEAATNVTAFFNSETFKKTCTGLGVWAFVGAITYGILSIFDLSRPVKITLSVLTPLAIIVVIAMVILRGFVPSEPDEYVVVRRN